MQWEDCSRDNKPFVKLEHKLPSYRGLINNSLQNQSTNHHLKFHNHNFGLININGNFKSFVHLSKNTQHIMNIINKFSEKNNVISVSKKDENKFDNININLLMYMPKNV